MTPPTKRVAGEWVRWAVMLLVMVGAWLIAFGEMRQQQKDLETIPPRVVALEKTVEVEKSKREGDREVLQEVRQDVKDIRNALLQEGRRRR